MNKLIWSSKFTKSAKKFIKQNPELNISHDDVY
jgi:hypothetical protein